MATLFGAQDRLNQLLQQSQQRRTKQQQEAAALAMRLAQTPQQAGINAVGASFGTGLGQGLARSLFGESDVIKQARGDVEQEAALREKLANVKRDDPQALAGLSRELIKVPGFEQQGLALGQQAIDLSNAQKQARNKLNQDTLLAQYAVEGSDKIKTAYISAGGDPKNLELVSDKDNANPYVVVGNAIFDKDTATFLTPDKVAEQQKDKYKVTQIGKDRYGVLNEATGDIKELESSTAVDAEQDKEQFLGTLGKLAQFDQTLGVIDRALEDVSGAGIEYPTLSKLPGNSDSRRLSNALTTIRANLAFDRLQKMRDESKTGGALGQVSNIELGLLESSIEALQNAAGTSEEEATKLLINVKKHYNNLKNAVLGKTPAIEWDSPAYKDYVRVEGGNRYWVDENSGKVWKIGTTTKQEEK